MAGFSTLLSCSYKFQSASISQHSTLAHALFLYQLLELATASVSVLSFSLNDWSVSDDDSEDDYRSGGRTSVTNNSLSEDYPHPDYHAKQIDVFLLLGRLRVWEKRVVDYLSHFAYAIRFDERKSIITKKKLFKNCENRIKTIKLSRNLTHLSTCWLMQYLRIIKRFSILYRLI